MTQRIAPRGGYDAGIKRQYRRNVWCTLSRLCPVPLADAKVFILPSSEGDEIEVAKSKGIREANIDICDSNPAIAATIKRRYPLVRAHGVLAARALRERRRSYHLINIDLCGTVNSVGRTAYWAGRQLIEGGVMAATWIKGRDKKVSDLIKRVGSESVTRPVLVSFGAWAGHNFASLLDGGRGEFAGIPIGNEAEPMTEESAIRYLRTTLKKDGYVRSLVQVRNESYVLHRAPMEWAAWKSQRRPGEVHDAWLWMLYLATAPHVGKAYVKLYLDEHGRHLAGVA